MQFISRKIDEYVEQIDYYQQEIMRLKQLIKELRWRALPDEDGEIISYEDTE
jgi:prefoldin subunit 5